MKRKFVFLLVMVLALSSRGDITPAVPSQVEPFDLSDVRLLDGLFKDAMERDQKYLLSLEPDRLLSWFRKESGLKPKGQVYGGWESRGVAGHTLGHYLSACSHMYAATGDRRFLERVNYIVDQLDECQRANGNGYVAAIPGGRGIFEKVARGDIESAGFDLDGGWVPWYTLHKEFAGLIDAYQLCANTTALMVVTNLANWAADTTKNLTPVQWQRMLVCEQGGMNESLANLYAITGNTNYLNLSREFYHQEVLDPLAQGRDLLAGLHANMQIPKVIGMARLYELTGNPRDEGIARFFWESVVLHHSFVIGGDGDHEHFFSTNAFAQHLSDDTAETCCTYNMLKLTRHLFEWSPEATEMDFYERALYNDILASQDPDEGMFVYLMPLKSGHFKTFSTPEDSFWCCVGTGMENHAIYGNSIYFHDDRSLFVNLFIPSVLTWPEKKLILRQETRFPDNGITKLNLKLEHPVRLALKIRWPAWSAGLTLLVNGREQAVSRELDSYVSLTREWQDGDLVEVHLSMKLHTEPLPGSTNTVAVLYGPIVLGGALGTNGMTSSYAADHLAYDKVSDPGVPVFVADHDSLLKHIKATREPLVFRTKNLGRPYDVTLIPFYKLNYQRYAIYWELLSTEEWKAKNAAQAAETARTVDAVIPGDLVSENNHQYQGDNTHAGNAGGHSWRDASGWFGYKMNILPNRPMLLACTFWGGDNGAREFDITVDGSVIATEKVENNHPGDFFEVVYPLPFQLTKGKKQVSVKFTAHPGNIAGGLFGCRILSQIH